MEEVESKHEDRRRRDPLITLERLRHLAGVARNVRARIEGEIVPTGADSGRPVVDFKKSTIGDPERSPGTAP